MVVLRGEAGVREAGVHVGVWRRAGPGCMGDEEVRGEVGEAGTKPLRTKTVTGSQKRILSVGRTGTLDLRFLWSELKDNPEAGWSEV